MGIPRTAPHMIPPSADLRIRFAAHEPTAIAVQAMDKLRSMGLDLAVVIEQICPFSPETRLAIECVDQAIMFANASIARAHPRYELAERIGKGLKGQDGPPEDTTP